MPDKPNSSSIWQLKKHDIRSMNMLYRHLFFDLDHTLWDFDTNSRLTLQHLHEKYALQTRGVSDFDTFFERYLQHNERLWKRYTNGFIKQEELRWKRMWFTLLDDKVADEALSKQLSIDFLAGLPERTALFPYTVEILTYLQAKGYTLHLITNGFEEVQHHKIRHSGIKHFFTHVITSEASGSLKPKKAIFDYALQAANATASESIIIGDNEEADIAGGNNAGWHTVWVNHLQKKPTVNATYTVTDLQALKNIF